MAEGGELFGNDEHVDGAEEEKRVGDEFDFGALFEGHAAEADAGDMAEGVAEFMEIGCVHGGEGAGVAGVGAFGGGQRDGDGEAIGFEGEFERVAGGAAVVDGEGEKVVGGGMVSRDEDAAGGVEDLAAAAIAGAVDEEGHGGVMDPGLEEAVPGEGITAVDDGTGGGLAPVGGEAAKRDAAEFVETGEGGKRQVGGPLTKSGGKGEKFSGLRSGAGGGRRLPG